MMDQLSEVELAVAYARGLPGRMLPSPDAADSEEAIALLRYASAIKDAEGYEPAS